MAVSPAPRRSETEATRVLPACSEAGLVNVQLRDKPSGLHSRK